MSYICVINIIMFAKIIPGSWIERSNVEKDRIKDKENFIRPTL